MDTAMKHDIVAIEEVTSDKKVNEALRKKLNSQLDDYACHVGISNFPYLITETLHYKIQSDNLIFAIVRSYIKE